MRETLFDELYAALDEQEKERLLRELVNHPNETLGEALSVLTSTTKSRWEIAVQVIRAIRYPQNAPAIPCLISHVGDKNSPAWHEAVKALEDMGPKIVVPYLLLDFWERDRFQYWGDHMEGISLMLCEVDLEYALQCGPALAHLLERNDLPPNEELDRGFLLDVLEKIGPGCAEYAMPVLIDLITREGKSSIGMRALHLVTSFDSEILERYEYVLVSLQRRDLYESN